MRLSCQYLPQSTNLSAPMCMCLIEVNFYSETNIHFWQYRNSVIEHKRTETEN